MYFESALHNMRQEKNLSYGPFPVYPKALLGYFSFSLAGLQKRLKG